MHKMLNDSKTHIKEASVIIASAITLNLDLLHSDSGKKKRGKEMCQTSSSYLIHMTPNLNSDKKKITV